MQLLLLSIHLPVQYGDDVQYVLCFLDRLMARIDDRGVDKDKLVASALDLDDSLNCVLIHQKLLPTVRNLLVAICTPLGWSPCLNGDLVCLLVFSFISADHPVKIGVEFLERILW